MSSHRIHGNDDWRLMRFNLKRFFYSISACEIRQSKLSHVERLFSFTLQRKRIISTKKSIILEISKRTNKL